MRILRDFGPRGRPSWPSWSKASLSRSLLAVRAGGFCVAPQAGPKIRALGAPLGHCERRPGAAGPPSSGPKKTAFASSARGRAVAPWPGGRGPALRRAAPRCFAGRDSSQTERNSPGLHGAVPALAARPSLDPFWAFLAAPRAAWSRASASCVGVQGRGLKQGPSRFKARASGCRGDWRLQWDPQTEN